jgi:hypothetical protein
MQHRNGGQDLGNDRRGLGRRSDGHSASTPFQGEHGIALVRSQATELVLHFDTGLAAKIDEIFALHVQFARQGINTYSIQAELLYSLSPKSPKIRGCQSSAIFPF